MVVTVRSALCSDGVVKRVVQRRHPVCVRLLGDHTAAAPFPGIFVRAWLLRPTLAKGHSVSDSTSWAYALLVVLLAAPVLAAVVVLVTMVGQSETNHVPVQASGSSGQSVAQDVRPVIVMQRVSRGSARRPGSASDPVGRQGASPATFHERIDRFTSRRREPTRRRRGDAPAGDPDQVPYPSSSWPAVAPPLIETPGVTSPDANASGGLGSEASPPRSWGQWVRALVELTLTPRQVRPPVGGPPPGAVQAIVAEPPEIPARAEGAYMLPPIRVRAGLVGTEGSPRLPLMVAGIAEIEASADASSRDGADELPPRAGIAPNDVDGFELALVPAVIYQATQVQLSFLLAAPDTGDGLLFAGSSLHELARFAALAEVVPSVQADVSTAAGSTDAEVEPVVAMRAPEMAIEPVAAEVVEAPVVELDPVAEVPDIVMANEPVMADVAEPLVAEAELVEVDAVVAMPAPEMAIKPVMADVAEPLVAEAELVEVDAVVAMPAPEMAIEPVMADVAEPLVAEAELVEVDAVVAMPAPVMTIEPVMAEVVAAPVAELEPVVAMRASEMAIEPVAAEVVAAPVAELDPVAEVPDIVMAVEPDVAVAALIAEAELVEVDTVVAMPAPEMAIEPVMADVAEPLVAEAELVEVDAVVAMPAPEMAIEPVMADVAEPLVAEAELVEVDAVVAMPAPVMTIEPIMADVVAAPVAEAELVELDPVVAIPAPEMAVESVMAEVAEGSASDHAIGEDPEALGFDNQLVSDAWAAMMQLETVDVATPSLVELELEPFVDVPIAAFGADVDGNGAEALVTPEVDEFPVAAVPTDQSGPELSLNGMDVLDSGQSATDEAEFNEIDGLDSDEEVQPATPETTFTPPPPPPVEEPQPAWMPLPRSPKFRWVRVAMQATEVTVPRDIFAGQ